MSQCNRGSDTCPDSPLAFELARMAEDAADRRVPVVSIEESNSDVAIFWKDRDNWRERAEKAEAEIRKYRSTLVAILNTRTLKPWDNVWQRIARARLNGRDFASR